MNQYSWPRQRQQWVRKPMNFGWRPLVNRGRSGIRFGREAKVAYDVSVSSPKYLLVLEDSSSRLMALRGAAKRLSLQVAHWSDVHTMLEEAPRYFENTSIISLDYDLSGSPYCQIGDPGTGQDIVGFLLKREPFCPVMLHTSLDNRGKTLAALLRSVGWQSDWVGLKEFKDLERWERLVSSWLAAGPGKAGQGMPTKR